MENKANESTIFSAFIAALIVNAMITYPVTSFIQWDFNPGRWSTLARVTDGIAFTLTLLIAWVNFPAISFKRKESNKGYTDEFIDRINANMRNTQDRINKP